MTKYQAPIMDNGISEAQPRRSRVRLSKSLQEHLLNAIAKPSPVSAGIPQDAPTRPTKRQLDDIDQLHAKKARLTDAQQPEVEGERVQPAEKVRHHTHLWDQVLMVLGRHRSSSIRNRSLRTLAFLRNLSIPPSRVLTALFSSGLNRLGPTEINGAGQIAILILPTTAPSRDSSQDQHRQ